MAQSWHFCFFGSKLRGWYFCYFLLFLSVSFGQECQMSHYTISTVCTTPYGTILSNLTGIRSAMDCANMCAYSISCKSAVFENATGSCTTNSDTLQNPTAPNASCLEPVFYAVPDYYSVICGSTDGPGSIYSSCVNNAQCSSVSDTECRHGKCQCMPGLSYDPVTDACLPVCSNGYGTTFSEEIGYYLDGYNDRVIDNVIEPALCLNHCVSETTFTCRSAELDLLWGVCFLSVDTVSSQPMAHYPDSNYTLYQRDCADV